MMMRGGLERAGYEACDDDAGLFRKVKPDGSFVLIGLHVDDSLIVYNSDEELQDIVDAMSATFGKDKVKLVDTVLALGALNEWTVIGSLDVLAVALRILS